MESREQPKVLELPAVTRARKRIGIARNLAIAGGVLFFAGGAIDSSYTNDISNKVAQETRQTHREPTEGEQITAKEILKVVRGRIEEALEEDPIDIQRIHRQTAPGNYAITNAQRTRQQALHFQQELDRRLEEVHGKYPFSRPIYDKTAMGTGAVLLLAAALHTIYSRREV